MNWPGVVNWITPPQAQMHLQPSCRAGLPATTMVAEPGAQGAGMTGRHGCGVRTPEAAAVAAATGELSGEPTGNEADEEPAEQALLPTDQDKASSKQEQ